MKVLLERPDEIMIPWVSRVIPNRMSFHDSGSHIKERSMCTLLNVFPCRIGISKVMLNDWRKSSYAIYN